LGGFIWVNFFKECGGVLRDTLEKIIVIVGVAGVVLEEIA